MGLRIAIYIFLILWLYYSSAMFVLKRFRHQSKADAVVALTITAVSVQVFTGWVLGLVGHLFAVELFISNIFIATILLLLSRPSRGDLPEPFRLIRGLFRALRSMCRRVDFLLLLILDLILLVLVTARGIIYPEYSWDGVHYHLGEVGFMLQDGGLGFIRSYPLESYPRNIELTYLWNTIFPRHQLLMNCLQIPYIFLAMFACYGIMRKAGCRRESAAFAAMIFPTFPIIIQQATTAYIDIAVSACLLSGINFLAPARLRIADILPAGLAMGLVIGGKGSGVLLAGSATLVWLLLGGWGMFRRKRASIVFACLLVFVCAMLLNGAWIYIRNWVVLGDPVYPYKVSVGGREIFKGTMGFDSHAGPGLLKDYYKVIMRKPWLERMYFTWAEPGVSLNYDGRTGGFGPLFFIIYLPCMAAAAITSLIQRRWPVLFIFALLTAPLLAIHEVSWWLRYSIFYITAGMLGFAYIDGIISRRDTQYWLRYISLALALVSSILFYTNKIPGVEGLRLYIHKGPHYWHSSQYSTEGMHKFLYRAIYPYQKPGTTIMVDGSLTYYKTGTGGEFICLWNLDFSNRVIYASTDNRDEWFKTLVESNADYVLVGDNGKSKDWVMSCPERFKRLVEKDGFGFYSVYKQ